MRGDCDATHNVYPYLLSGLEITRGNQVWGADITYIRMAKAFVDLTAVMDWQSRYVLAWEVSVTQGTQGFCLSALESALRRHGRPQIFNTDQGAELTGKAFTGALQAAEIRISTGR